MKSTQLFQNPWAKYLAAILALGLLIALMAAFSARPSYGQNPEPLSFNLDHFKCYETLGSSVDDLAFLRDQFGAQDKKIERDVVKDPKFFCNPARKLLENGQNAEIKNFDGHLTWYNFSPIFRENFNSREVIVTNQLTPNGQKLIVEKPKFLAVPTEKVSVNGEPTGQKMPRGLDHFKCYTVRPDQTNPMIVRLWDQFTAANTWDRFKVLQAKYLCNPVVKAHFTGFTENDTAQFTTAQIQNPNDHLVCYGLSPDKKAGLDVVANNQFGDGQKLTVIQSKLLCVPSLKKLVEPFIPTSGD